VHLLSRKGGRAGRSIKQKHLSLADKVPILSPKLKGEGEVPSFSLADVQRRMHLCFLEKKRGKNFSSFSTGKQGSSDRKRRDPTRTKKTVEKRGKTEMMSFGLDGGRWRGKEGLCKRGEGSLPCERSCHLPRREGGGSSSSRRRGWLEGRKDKKPSGKGRKRVLPPLPRTKTSLNRLGL